MQARQRPPCQWIPLTVLARQIDDHVTDFYSGYKTKVQVKKTMNASQMNIITYLAQTSTVYPPSESAVVFIHRRQLLLMI